MFIKGGGSRKLTDGKPKDSGSSVYGFSKVIVFHKISFNIAFKCTEVTFYSANWSVHIRCLKLVHNSVVSGELFEFSRFKSGSIIGSD